jgi:hypothetical protein
MATFLSPLNFATIQGAPHAVPEKAIDKLPIFHGNNVVSAQAHISCFRRCVDKYCGGHNEEDVKMTLFVYSLEGMLLIGLKISRPTNLTPSTH